MTNVITYSASNGERINLTPAEIEAHEAAGTWPRNSVGEEYCQVHHGLHYGWPSSAFDEQDEVWGRDEQDDSED